MPDLSARTDVARAVNVLGFTLFGCVAAILGMGVLQSGSVDLRVYHLAASHVLSDDVYLHKFPDWPFVYPPSALLLLAPMGAPMQLARVLMFLVSIASVWITMHLTTRSCAEGTVWARPGAVAAYSTVALLSWPLLLGMGLGQVAPVVMGLLALGMLGRPSRWSGAWIGTAAAIKLTPALFGLHLWMVGRRRAAAIAAATFAAWYGVSAIVMPNSAMAYLRGGVADADGWYAADAGNLSNQALTGIAARAGLESQQSRLVVLGVSVVLLFVGLLAARRLHDAGWTAVGVALVGVWSGVAAPVGWIHSFGWWVPLAVAIGLTGREKSDVLVALAVIVLPSLLLIGRFGDVSLTGVSGLLWSSNYAIVSVLVTGWLWWRVRVPTRVPEEAPVGL